MSVTIVTTFAGKTANKTECRKMDGIYYIKGDPLIENSGECYKIGDTFYKSHTGYIIYDHAVKSYVLKKDFNKSFNTTKGLIGFNENNTPLFGAFTIKNKYKSPFILIDGGKYICINEDIVKNNPKYAEDLASGVYMDRRSVSAYRFALIDNCDQRTKNSLPYDSRGIMDNVMAIHNKFYEPEYCKDIEKLDEKFIKGLTFGLEFETTKGMIPKIKSDYLGLLPLRDGSINGLEYVTIPLKGKEGLQTVLDSLTELNKRTKYDNNCSLHLHIGGVPRTEEFFLAVYKILFLIQDDMFSLFPFHKKENYGIKRKHYTKPFPLKETMLLFDKDIKTKEDVKNNFNILYKFLSMNQDYFDAGANLDNIIHHPSDPGGHSKWNITSRYHFVNLIPLLFGNKETIEFRLHTPTYNKAKVMNYLLICFAVIKYAMKHQDKILTKFENYVNISLTSIVYDIYSSNNQLTEELSMYIERRKGYFYNKTRNGDFVANEDDFKYYSNYFNWGEVDLNPKPYKYSIRKSYNAGLDNNPVGNWINIAPAPDIPNLDELRERLENEINAFNPIRLEEVVNDVFFGDDEDIDDDQVEEMEVDNG